jgi:hypothetical protein
MRYIDPKVWVRTWKEAGPRLEAIRRQELQNVDTASVIRSLSDAFVAANRTAPPRGTSGLVEQQRLFARMA